MKKKIISCICAVVLAAGCGTSSAASSVQTPAAAASASASAAAVKDGTYEGTARGNNGDITVATTITNGKITDVAVESEEETNGISDTPLKVIPQRIVDNNSVKVDTMSGSTMTSAGIINAVRDSLTSNGIDVSLFENKVVEDPMPAEDTDTDIVVVGSGAAGIQTAGVAAQNGAKVILVEKQDIIGGTSLLSASMFGCVGTRVQKAEGLTETTEDLYESYMKPEAATGGAQADSDAAMVLAEGSTNEAEYLLDLGVDFDHTSSDMVLAPAAGKRVGEMVIPAIAKVMEDAGVDVRTGARATKVLIEDGKAAGIEVENKDGGTYTIHAKAVVLATGGFAASKEMLEKYLPEWTDSIYYCSPGDTGDGIVMAQDAGLDTINLDIFKANPLVFHDGAEALTMNAAVGDGALMVNHEGKRFANEQGGYGISPKIKEQTDGEGIVFFDETEIANNETMKDYLDKGYLTRCSSLDDLAEKFNIDADALKETVENYQKEAADGEDTEFGRKTVADLYSGSEFYAVAVRPSIQGTFGGIHTNTDTEVYSTDGEIVPGMYAVGECAAEGINGLNPMTANMVFGRIAGTKAAEYVKE